MIEILKVFGSISTKSILALQYKAQFPEAYDGKLVDKTNLEQKYEKLIKNE